MVGLAGFEPTTSCPPDKRANQAAPQPDGVSHYRFKCREERFIIETKPPRANLSMRAT
jgi:hypothetical protein